MVDEIDTADAPADDDDDMISCVDVGPTSDDVEEEDHSNANIDDSALANDDDQPDEVRAFCCTIRRFALITCW